MTQGREPADRTLEGKTVFINTWNHIGNIHGAANFFRYFRNALTRSGAQTLYSVDYVGGEDAINIIIDSFSKETAEFLINRKKQQGGRLIVMVTEFLTGATFNDFGQHTAEKGTNYEDRQQWKERYDAFMAVAGVADALWLPTLMHVESYTSAFPEKPVLYCPLRFDPMQAQAPVLPSRKLYPVVFLGSHTAYRRGLIESLQKQVPLICPPILPELIYNDFCSAARITLHLRISQGWPYTSVMRHHDLLHADSYVISEACPIPGDLDDYVEIVPRSDLAAVIRERLADARLHEKALEKKQRFQAAGTSAPAVADILLKSIGERAMSGESK